jgi:hypothetical protein
MTNVPLRRPLLPKYQNSILIKVPRELSTPHIALYRALRDNLDNFKTEHIKIICQLKKKFDWLIGFDKAYDANQLIGKKLSCEKYSLDILDPNATSEFYSCTLRVHFLPPIISSDSISRYIRSQINIEAIEIERERYRAEELSNIENGILRIKLRTKRQEKTKIDTILGKKVIKGFKVLITRVGDPVICYYCEQYGHLQSNCEEKIRRRNLQCDKCHKKGHSTEECNFAKRLNVQNEQDDEELDEAEEIETKNVSGEV